MWWNVLSLSFLESQRYLTMLFQLVMEAWNSCGLSLAAECMMSDIEFNIRSAFADVFLNITSKGCSFFWAFFWAIPLYVLFLVSFRLHWKECIRRWGTSWRQDWSVNNASLLLRWWSTLLALCGSGDTMMFTLGTCCDILKSEFKTTINDAIVNANIKKSKSKKTV